MDSAWWTSKTAGKQLIMSPNMVTRIKPNWEQIKIWFQVSFVIRHGTCRDCEMLQCGTTERHSCFKVLALDRAVRNLYISSCIFRCLHQERVKVDDQVLFRRSSCAIWIAQPQWISHGTCAVRAVASESERQPLMVPVIRCRLCRATRVNATADTLGKLAARDGVLLVQGIFSGDGGSS